MTTETSTETSTEALISRVDHLLTAMAGMSPGPWAYRPREHDDWGMVRGPDSWIVALARDGGTSDDRDEQRHRDAGTDPYEGNARAVTALPDIRALLTDLRPFLVESATRICDLEAQNAAQAEALAAEREQVSLLRLDNDGHMECLAETHQDLLRELPDSETTALLGRMLARWQRTPGQRQYMALSEVEGQAEVLARVEKVRDELRSDTRVHRTAAADSVQAGLWMLNTRCSAFAEVTHETACRLTTALLGAQS